MFSHFSRKDKLYAALSVSAFIFSMETIIGFHTRSLVLLADTIHALNNTLSFSTTLGAEKLQETHSKHLPQSRKTSPLLASFFRGILLLGLGINLIACAISLFISRIRMQNPLLVLSVGCVSLGLNLLTALAFHVEDKGEDLESGIELRIMYSHETYLMHVLADLTCNLGVIIVAVIVMQLTTESRYYADPGASIGIGIVIVTFAARLAKTNWVLLHQPQDSGLRSSNGGSGLDGHVDEQGGNEYSPSDAGEEVEEGKEGENENPWSEDQEEEQGPEPGEDNENGSGDEFGNDDQYEGDDPTDNPEEDDNDSGVMNEDEFQDENQEESQETDNNFNSEENHEDPATQDNEENGQQEPENEDSWDDIPIEDTINPQSENAEPSDDQNQREETTEEPGYGESNDTSPDPNSWNNGGESKQVTSEEISPDLSTESTPDNEEQKQVQQIVQAVENNNLGPEGDSVANLIKRAKMALIF